jgi:hypothetical protein
MARYWNAGTYKSPAPWESLFFIPIILIGLSLIAILLTLILSLVLILSLGSSNNNGIMILSLTVSYAIGIYFIRKPLIYWIKILFYWIIRKKGKKTESILFRIVKLFVLIFIEIPLASMIIWFTLFIIVGMGYPNLLYIFSFETFSYLTLFTYRIGIYLLISIPISSYLIEKYLPEDFNKEINSILSQME